MSTKPFAAGRCLCGAVRLTITGEPVSMTQCHCNGCQRASGTGHMSIARVRCEDVAIEGETTIYASTADSGNINTRHFCPACGARLSGRNSGRPGFISVAVGCREDLSWFKPSSVIYANERPCWDITSTEVDNFEAMPPR